MKSASNRTKYFLAVISLGFVYGSMFNLAYMKYIFYDAIQPPGRRPTQLTMV